jgi:hypothetical protein
LTVVDAALFLRARSLTGGSTLTGGWYGELTVPKAGTQRVYIELSGFLASRCHHCRRIDGCARLCDGTGAITEFNVDGNPNDWRGTSFWITTGRIDNRDGRGVQLGRVDGKRQDDTIQAQAALRFYHVEGGVSRATMDVSRDEAGSSGTEPVVPLVLRRASEDQFLAACGRPLKSGRSDGKDDL